MFTAVGITDFMEMDGMQATGMADGTQDIGEVFVLGDSIIGTIHTGDTAAIGGIILTGVGVTPIIIHGSITDQAGVIMATITHGITTTMAIQLLLIEADPIKTDMVLEVNQIDQIWAPEHNQA
jgi:hypothetical protein